MGAFVWTRLEAGPSTLDALAVEVAEVFEVDFEQCRADLDRLAVSLASAGLVSED